VGFDAILRDGIKTLNTVMDSLQDKTVQHFRWIAEDAFGAKQYAVGDPVIRSAIVEFTPNVKFTRGGVEIPMKARILILEPFAGLTPAVPGRVEPVDLRDMFILPDGSTGPIVALPGLVDPTTHRTYFAEIVIGEA